MKLFIETSLSDLYMSIINNKVIAKRQIKNLVKKTDAFYENLDQLFKEANVNIEEITDIYTTLGPGSFSGARIGFLFAKTIAQISNTNFYVVPTYKLISKQKETLNLDWKNVYIKANRYSSYWINIENNNECSIVENENNNDDFIYDLFEKDPEQFFILFNKVESNKILDVELLYLHEPQIGVEKC
ncbi:tRNA (adenosine(37)-N6)-threonylcarbamoyltransferase complex dimerization subunit type 1 TsaB [Metamycoplasma spumans]|uniref:tRNA (adenosine(37)-N6)-threonylcarbamoyltransferase complex dimerization subunit type 1 TsaB n=1 Tax=Metamycoplasma spumans TaxID=92406 RepID=UPI0034DD48AB